MSAQTTKRFFNFTVEQDSAKPKGKDDLLILIPQSMIPHCIEKLAAQLRAGGPDATLRFYTGEMTKD